MAANTRNWDDIYKNISSLSQEDRNEIESIVRDWDPDFTKVTPLEKKRLDDATKEIAKGAAVKHSDIDWS